MEEFKQLSHKILYKGFVGVEEYVFEIPSQHQTARRIIVKRPDAVAILLINKSSNTVILIKQFRAPVYAKEGGDGYVYEIPAGVMEAGENPEETIIRETLEETGYKSQKPELLLTFYPTVGILDEKIHLYSGIVTEEDKIEDGGGLDTEKEFIDIIELPYSEALSMVDNGEIVDGKTIIGLFYLKKLIENGSI
jgi:nudix-type nucleoside diphosphatase (YffH/AdpP family)